MDLDFLSIEEKKPALATNGTLLRLGLICLCIIGLQACASNRVDVQDDQYFPVPLVSKLPIQVGVHIPEEFQTYEYVEKDSKGRIEVRVKLGNAQTNMVRAIVPSIFSSGQLVAGVDSATLPAGTELYVVPSVDKFEFSTPSITRNKVYEVWIKYRFDVYEPGGQLLVSWPVPSYGKTKSAFLKNKGTALDSATQVALRDCGAAFSTGFSKLPEIEQWLEDRGRL